MSMSDYRRPAPYQITKHYQCQVCHRELTAESGFSPGKCCNRYPIRTGESYPGDSREWDEVRDNVNDRFQNRNRRGGW